eukprot:715498-Rhodomonas_salina.1
MLLALCCGGNKTISYMQLHQHVSSHTRTAHHTASTMLPHANPLTPLHLSTSGINQHPRWIPRGPGGCKCGGVAQPSLLPLRRHRQYRQPHGVQLHPGPHPLLWSPLAPDVFFERAANTLKKQLYDSGPKP